MARKQKKIKSDAAAFPVPQNRDEAIAAVASIGTHQRERQRIEAALNDEVAAVKQRHEEQAAPHTQAIQGHSAGVQTWAEANRADLTQGGKTKTVELPSGNISWRIRPPKVSLKAVDNIINALKGLKLKRFIRVKEEVNKEAILAEPEAVRNVTGITISQGEDFVITPFETELDEVVT